MSLLDLSAELLIDVAASLSQLDLLNVSVTCKRLRYLTEIELFREYRNLRPGCHPFLSYIKKIIERPDLAKYVRFVDLRPWETLDILHPAFSRDDEEDGPVVENLRANALSRSDYKLLTETAKAAGVITAIYPYELSSGVIDQRDLMDTHPSLSDDPWYANLFDPSATSDEIPYDRKYCQTLRAGIEDPFVVLILALLPKVEEIFLRGGPRSVNNLAWRAHHGFVSLRSLTVCEVDEQLIWPVSFLSTLLSNSKQLEVLKLKAGTSWHMDVEDSEPDVSKTAPLAFRPGSLSHIRRLEMKRCNLKASDMWNLLRACTGLKSFYYSGGDEQQYPLCSTSPANMIQLLYPLKDSLETLTLELSTDWYENIQPGHESRIGSLRHMKALKILDTSAEMWLNVGLEDLGSDEFDPKDDDSCLTKRSRLCRRLPPSLHTLLFHLSPEGEEPALGQIKDLVRKQRKVLPNLQNVFVETKDPEYAQGLDKISENKKSELNIGHNWNSGPEMHALQATVFDNITPCRDLPDTRWFGNTYTTRRRKPVRSHPLDDNSMDVDDVMTDAEWDDYIREGRELEKATPEDLYRKQRARKHSRSQSIPKDSRSLKKQRRSRTTQEYYSDVDPIFYP